MRSLPAIYRGFSFRSRLEARNAIFFDAMGEPWEYEPEALDLGGGLGYIPDFRLSVFRAWVEAKGDLVNDAAGLRFIAQCSQLAAQSGRPVILAFRDPYDGRLVLFQGNRMYKHCRWDVCPMCGKLAILVRSDDEQQSARWCPRKHTENTPLDFNAMREARRALFNAALQSRQHQFGFSRKDRDTEEAPSIPV